MAYGVYTALLGEGHFAAGVTVIGGPWPGLRVVVKTLLLVDYGGDSGYAVVQGAMDGAPLAGWVTGAPDSGVLDWSGTQALQDGDTLTLLTDGSEVAVRVSGYLLTLP